MKEERPPLLTLANYQERARDSLAASVQAVAALLRDQPDQRDAIARSAGIMLLEAPTGSGKTLVLGRALEAVRGALPERCVWFWFAPYSGLVAQTREALSQQCPSLRLRNVQSDRGAKNVRDGDVFVQTWASVAANNKDSRKARRDAEDALSLDDMLAELRADGVHIGVVIDEAHVNFGASAKAAAEFYLATLRPDFTLLATATPNDEKLEEFEQRAGIVVESRITIERGEVVRAALNKHGLMLGVLRFSSDDQKLIDPEQATLTAAWLQHNAIKSRLVEKGRAVTPLMLVQVEDQARGGADPVRRVREKLREVGVPDSVIAVHTSGEPDPDFHTLAYDPGKEVLVFKVSVATGFDAPRAWTLVSVRPNRGKAFGMQIVGRIMRVHPDIRPLHGTDPLLDRGYVFLTDPELQAGLDAAAEELKAVRSSIDVIADELSVIEFSNFDSALLAERQKHLPHTPRVPQSDAERQQRLLGLIEGGFVADSVLGQNAAKQDQAIVTGEWRKALSATPLFGDLPETPAPSKQAIRREKRFPLRTDLGIPRALLKEVLPPPDQYHDLTVAGAAKALFRQAETPLDSLTRVRTHATLALRDIFLMQEEERKIAIRMSAARVAQAAQASFEFNDQIDTRALKQALIEEFARVCEEEGAEYTEKDLRRALDLFAMSHPTAIPTAVREAQASHVLVQNAEPLPDLFVSDEEAHRKTTRGAYAVYPPNMNKEELAFAELLDKDTSGRVKWWLRLQENASWAPALVLPTGHRFFPDFAVGVNGRASPDSIALVEIKDDGETGRLHSQRNRDKIRTQHREYKRVTWTYRRKDGRWVEAVYDSALEDIVPKTAFSVETLVHVT
ncbi:DEAD/DEAH box helicase [Terricaulis sp.]|uniref:DEAD/DEAH box helicase n=1 Tax=Terricaulis sp. TaxID=2768686 RepID=UPI003783290A